MFCPSCGKQNQEDVTFCTYCGKALPQKSSPPPANQSAVGVIPGPKKASAKKVRMSDTAMKAIITGILIVGLVLVVLWIYYPGVFPWNW